MTIVWTRPAVRDVAQLRDYIARESPANAAVVAQRLRDAVATLDRFPARGRPGQAPDTRELVVPRTPYIVVYRVSEDAIVVLRVLHGAQRWPSI